MAVIKVKTASKTFSQEKIVAITIRKKSIRKIAILVRTQEQLISGRSKVKLIKNNILFLLRPFITKSLDMAETFKRVNFLGTGTKEMYNTRKFCHLKMTLSSNATEQCQGI
jgi:hypothetical protein